MSIIIRIFDMFFEIMDNKNARFVYRLGQPPFTGQRRVRFPYRVQKVDWDKHIRMYKSVRNANHKSRCPHTHLLLS